MASSDFEKRMRQALNKQRESRDLTDKTKLHETEIMKTVGSSNWEKLTDNLEKTISSINKGFDVINYVDMDGTRV